MGLDASVWCNCVETGKIHTPHPFPQFLVISEDGMPDVRSEDEIVIDAHDAWLWNSPCEHEECTLLHHRLGNISLIALLREVVSKLIESPEISFPVLWLQVIYSGSHAGDYLKVEDVKKLWEELVELRRRDTAQLKKNEVQFLHDFLQQMEELIAASLSINKPITF